MAIHKESATKLRKHGGTYVVLPSDSIRLIMDPVSLAIWAYLLDKPDNWIVRNSELQDRFGIGRDKTTSALGHLRDVGLVWDEYSRDDSGRVCGRNLVCSSMPNNAIAEQRIIRNTAEPNYGKGVALSNDISLSQVQIGKEEPSKDYLSCQHDEAINAVIDRINEITGQKLQPSAKVHRENISARLNDGFSLEDLISIVETKSAEWMGTKQQIYLVPKTLFRPSNFDRYLAESKMASKIPTAEQLVDVYHEKMPSMPSVGVITPKRRNLVTDFCLAGKMTVEKFSAYLDYIGSRCTWVMNPKYGYGFDFLVDRNTLDRARNTTLEDKIND